MLRKSHVDVDDDDSADDADTWSVHYQIMIFEFATPGTFGTPPDFS